MSRQDHPFSSFKQQYLSMTSAFSSSSSSSSSSSISTLDTSARLSGPARAASRDPAQKSSYDPPRITSNVKLNLQYLKRIKERRSGEKPATGYRRKKVERIFPPADEGAEWTENNKYGAFEDYIVQGSLNYPCSSMVLCILFGPFSLHSADDTFEVFEEARPVLLVDGYNMCGYWPKLKKHFKRGRLDHARHMLVEELIGFSALRSTKVVVVFDALMSGLADHKEAFMGVDLVFTASTTADTWIEREVTLLKQDGCPKVWVVTSDSLQQQCAYASGAFVWSCSFLITAIKDAKKERDEILREMTSYSMKGRLLEDNLDPEVCLSLKRLKQRLLQSEPS